MQGMQNVKFPNASLTIILSPGQYNQILYKSNTTYILSPTKLRTHGQTYKETHTNTINLVAYG